MPHPLSPAKTGFPIAPRRAWLAALACGALLCGYAVASWMAGRGKSPTIDEPLDALNAFVVRHYADYRVDPPNPPLWLRWVALPLGKDMIHVDLSAPEMSQMLTRFWQALRVWTRRTLFQTAGNDPEAFIFAARAMSLAAAVALGVIVTGWAWRLAGAGAAVVAAAAFSLDPNLLGHGPLVKNDLFVTFFITGALAALWSAGRRATVCNIVLAGICCGAAAATKFSGLLLAPVVLALAGIRVLLPCPWRAFGREWQMLRGRALVASMLIIAVATVAYAVVWASYGFRYGPTPRSEERLWIEVVYALAARAELEAQSPGRAFTPEELAAHAPASTVRIARWIDRHHLMPQAWTTGLVYIHSASQHRDGFLLGEVRRDGRWYYFPLAIAFKTPIAGLLMGAAAVIVLLAAWRAGCRIDPWTAATLATAAVVFGASLLTSHVNVGIRHAFLIYPLAILVVALAGGEALRRWGRTAAAIIALVFIGMAMETAMVFPNFLSFFNVAAGGSRGGLRLLSDSNLDWGQDLPLLARWRNVNPTGALFLDYCGSADPAYYVKQQPLWTADGQHLRLIDTGNAVVAVSATHLQGLYRTDAQAAIYAKLRQRVPLAVLGGTIYLYRGSEVPHGP